MKMVVNDKSAHSIGHLIAKPKKNNRIYKVYIIIIMRQSLNVRSKNERNLNEPSKCCAFCASCFAFNKFGILY